MSRPSKERPGERPPRATSWGLLVLACWVTPSDSTSSLPVHPLRLDECAPFYMCATTNSTQLCKVDASASYLRELRSPANTADPARVPLGAAARFTLVAADAAANGSACTTGGASFRAGLVGPAMLPARVLDNMDGTYGVVFHSGWLAGVYDLLIALEYDQCRSTTACKVQETWLELTPVRSADGTPYRVHVARSSLKEDAAWRAARGWDVATAPTTFGTANSTSTRWGWKLASRPGSRLRETCVGRWMRPLPMLASLADARSPAPLVWAPLGNATRAPASPDDPIRALRGRWLHFVGMSMMRTTVYTLVQAFMERERFEVQSADLWQCGLGKQVTVAFWVPRARVLITHLLHDWAWSDLRGFANGSAYADDHFKCLKHYLPPAVFATLMRHGPSALVYNRGLHLIEHLKAPSKLEEALRSEYAVLNAWTSALAGLGTALVLKTSPPTQWRRGELSGFYLCRTLQRLECLHAMHLAATPRGWLVADMAALGHMRADCTTDNRHYYCHGCREAFVDMVLSELHAEGRLRTELAGFRKGLGALAANLRTNSSHTHRPEQGLEAAKLWRTWRIPAPLWKLWSTGPNRKQQ